MSDETKDAPAEDPKKATANSSIDGTKADDATSSVRLPSCSAARFGPSGSSMILACSLRIASISISGRGGQPGRYMSTGTM